MTDLISRKAAIEVLRNRWLKTRNYEGIGEDIAEECEIYLKTLPSAQPTLYGYPVEHLALIARVLQKENFPPERIAEKLSDVGRIVEMVRDEFEETLRKAVEQCTMT